MHAALTASALEYGTIDYRVWPAGACVFGGGSRLASLDEGSVSAGTLPAGSHTFAVTFTNCLVDGLASTSLNGTASAVYTGVDMSDVTALVSTSPTRGTGLAFRSGLDDATSDGSGTWRRVTTGAGATTTYTPTAGSRLVNNLTGNSATFAGGSFLGVTPRLRRVRPRRASETSPTWQSQSMALNTRLMEVCNRSTDLSATRVDTQARFGSLAMALWWHASTAMQMGCLPSRS